MWKGKFDRNLKALFEKYDKRFDGYPDTYEEIAYDDMSYDEFVGYIMECLENGVEIPDVVV